MRLEALELERYGHFTDARLEFPRPDGPDLHVVYGANEAGKSTLLSAWLDLLFGFPHQTGYDFLHEARALRVAARITGPQGALHLARVKGRVGTLRDARTDAVQPEAVLGAALGGLDRASYTTMFSLDDDTLEEGGESILASEGDLGQLLFSASAGLADLSAELARARGELEGWFKPGAQKRALNVLKGRLAELTEARRAADLQISDWRRLKEAQAQAQARSAQAEEALRATRMAQEHARRDLDALPRLRRIAKLEGQLAALPPPEDLPPAWRAALPEWQREQAALAEALPAAARRVEDLRAALAALPDDPAAAAALPELDSLEARAGAIAAEAADLPRRVQEMAGLDEAMAACAAQLGAPGRAPEDLILPAALSAGLATLIEAEGVLRRAETTAAEELARAQDAVTGLPDGGSFDAQAAARLGPLVAELKREDLLQKQMLAEQGLSTASSELARAMAALAPWTGTLADLEAQDLPLPAALRGLGADLERARQDLAAQETERARLEGVTAQLRARIGGAAPVSEAEAAAARAARDAALRAHRARLDADTLAAFETALAEDDALGAQALAQARAAERLEQLRGEEAALARAREARAAQAAALAALEAQQATLSRAMLGAQATARAPEALLDWLDRRAAALQAAARRDAAEAARDAIAARIGTGLEALQAALRALGRGAGAEYATCLAEAEAVLAMAAELRASARARADLAAREKAVEECAAQRASWEADWARLCAEASIGTHDAGAAPEPAAMRAMLKALGELEVLVPQARALRRRIATMQANRADFDALLARHAGALGIAAEDGRWPQIRARLRAAHEAQITRAARMRDLEAATRDLEGLRARGAALEAALRPVQARLGAGDLAELAERIGAIGRACDLRAELAEARAELQAHLGTTDAAAEIARLGARDEAELRAEEAALAARLRAEDTRARETWAELARSTAAVEQAGSDAEAARLESARQTLMLQITDEARRYLARQAGVIAVEQALRHYRDEHRSGMMAQASAAFARLTAGRYARLSTRAEGTRDLLIAQPATGGAKPVDTLSKGTRFQLYLALRIAGYLEFAAKGAVVPFIADDIMETFDDTRAQAAFAALAEMAQHGQVIYLTHHAHLCALARAACPGVQIHEIGPPG